MTIRLALSGGGSKGDFELGAVRFLYDSGIRPSVISGCSVGAINAAKLAEGEDPADATRGLPGLEAIWSSLHTNSDMFAESGWLAGLPAEIKAAIEGQVPISALGPTTIPVAYFPDVSQIRQAFINLAYLTSTGTDILETFQSPLTQATSLFTLEPIRAKLTANLDPAKVAAWASQGNKLRLGMVALESGNLRYVTEGAALVERDGATAVMAQSANTCAPERQAVAAAENALQNAQKQLFAPNANKQTELGNVLLASKALSQAQRALASCESAAPAAPTAVQTDLTTAVLASAGFPGFFPPVPIATETYVDGGVRALIPVDGAVQAGATKVYAVSASPIQPDPAGGQWLMLDIAWRAVGLLTSEIALADSILRLDQAGVELTLIAPTVDVHAFDVIDPGLIQISREYVYMRGADVLQEFGPGDSVWNACETIVTQRLSIWALENQAHGQPDPTNPALQQGAANPGLQPQIDEAKGAFAVEIDSRVSAGGVIPPSLYGWTKGLELHQWSVVAPSVSDPVGFPTSLGGWLTYQNGAAYARRSGMRTADFSQSTLLVTVASQGQWHTYESGGIDWGYAAGRSWIPTPTGAGYCRRLGDKSPNFAQQALAVTTFDGANWSSAASPRGIDWGYDQGCAWISANGHPAYCRRVGTPGSDARGQALMVTLFDGAAWTTTASANGIDWGLPG